MVEIEFSSLKALAAKQQNGEHKNIAQWGKVLFERYNPARNLMNSLDKTKRLSIS